MPFVPATSVFRPFFLRRTSTTATATAMNFTTKNQVIIHLVLLSLFLVAFLSFGPWTLTTNIVFQQKVQNKAYVDELEKVLSAATTSDKTVIITVVNKAYVEPHNDTYPTMLDLFVEGIWVGGETTRPLLRHLVVVTVDQTAYERCKFRGLNCYRLVTEGVDFSEEKLYMSPDYIKMMWARTSFLIHVLKRGYNLIFTDTDILWLRDPFPILKMFNDTEDLQISTDKFNGNSTSIQNPINAGFYYVKSNNRTISLFETWYHQHQTSPGKGQQSVLAGLISGGITNQLHMTVRFLDNVHFSGFCTDSRDPKSVATVHANCCRTIDAKVADLTAVLRDWKRFIGRNGTAPFRWPVHGACLRSWTKL